MKDTDPDKYHKLIHLGLENALRNNFPDGPQVMALLANAIPSIYPEGSEIPTVFLELIFHPLTRRKNVTPLCPHISFHSKHLMAKDLSINTAAEMFFYALLHGAHLILFENFHHPTPQRTGTTAHDTIPFIHSQIFSEKIQKKEESINKFIGKPLTKALLVSYQLLKEAFDALWESTCPINDTRSSNPLDQRYQELLQETLDHLKKFKSTFSHCGPDYRETVKDINDLIIILAAMSKKRILLLSYVFFKKAPYQAHSILHCAQMVSKERLLWARLAKKIPQLAPRNPQLLFRHVNEFLCHTNPQSSALNHFLGIPDSSLSGPRAPKLSEYQYCLSKLKSGTMSTHARNLLFPRNNLSNPNFAQSAIRIATENKAGRILT